MSGGYPLGSVANLADIGTSGNGGSTVSSTTANTKGAYTQLSASLAADISAFWVFISESTVANQVAVDIAVGAAASEVVIAQNIMADMPVRNARQFYCPIPIAAGQRVSARMQSASASDSCRVSIVTMAGGLDDQNYQVCESIGWNSGASLGTQVDPGAVANTKGLYAQLVASTPRDYAAIAFLFDHALKTAVTSNLLFDLAIGGAGSEQVIIPNWPVRISSSGTLTGECLAPIGLRIPAGTRIAARCLSSDIALASRIFGVTVYGFH